MGLKKKKKEQRTDLADVKLEISYLSDIRASLLLTVCFNSATYAASCLCKNTAGFPALMKLRKQNRWFSGKNFETKIISSNEFQAFSPTFLKNAEHHKICKLLSSFLCTAAQTYSMNWWIVWFKWSQIKLTAFLQRRTLNTNLQTTAGGLIIQKDRTFGSQLSNLTKT